MRGRREGWRDGGREGWREGDAKMWLYVGVEANLFTVAIPTGDLPSHHSAWERMAMRF